MRFRLRRSRLPRPNAALAAVIAAVALGAAAFCTPAAVHKDQRDGLTNIQVRATKVHAGLMSEIPALHLQITEVRGHQPADHHGPVDGMVAWRTIFGVQYAETEIEGGGRSMTTDWDHQRWALTWLAFLAAEAGLLGFAGWRWWTAG